MLLVGFALQYASRFNREECRYALWIFKSVSPKLCDAKIFTVESQETESLHHFVIALDAHPERQFEPYVIAKVGKNLSRFSEKIIAVRSLKLNVWFDPKTDHAFHDGAYLACLV